MTAAILIVAVLGMVLGLYLILKPRRMRVGGVDVNADGDYQTEAAKVRAALEKRHAEQKLRARFGGEKVDDALEELRKKGYPV